MQKTAYEMRISDWSSDVCSSDLLFQQADRDRLRQRLQGLILRRAGELHDGIGDGIIADGGIQPVVPMCFDRLQLRLDVENELLPKAAFFLEQPVITVGLQSGDLVGRKHGALLRHELSNPGERK